MGVGGNGNLIPPKKGEVRNPKGKPKGTRNRKTIFKELLEQAALASVNKRQARALSSSDEDVIDLPQQTVADQVAASLLISAIGGDVAAARELMDSGFGKLTDKLENMHSFNKMGSVEAKVSDKEGDKSVSLSFDVGSEPQHETQEE